MALRSSQGGTTPRAGRQMRLPAVRHARGVAVGMDDPVLDPRVPRLEKSSTRSYSPHTADDPRERLEVRPRPDLWFPRLPVHRPLRCAAAALHDAARQQIGTTRHTRCRGRRKRRAPHGEVVIGVQWLKMSSFGSSLDPPDRDALGEGEVDLVHARRLLGLRRHEGHRQGGDGGPAPPARRRHSPVRRSCRGRPHSASRRSPSKPNRPRTSA